MEKKPLTKPQIAKLRTTFLKSLEENLKLLSNISSPARFAKQKSDFVSAMKINTFYKNDLYVTDEEARSLIEKMQKAEFKIQQSPQNKSDLEESNRDRSDFLTELQMHLKDLKKSTTETSFKATMQRVVKQIEENPYYKQNLSNIDDEVRKLIEDLKQIDFKKPEIEVSSQQEATVQTDDKPTTPKPSTPLAQKNNPDLESENPFKSKNEIPNEPVVQETKLVRPSRERGPVPTTQVQRHPRDLSANAAEQRRNDSLQRGMGQRPSVQGNISNGKKHIGVWSDPEQKASSQTSDSQVASLPSPNTASQFKYSKKDDRPIKPSKENPTPSVPTSPSTGPSRQELLENKLRQQTEQAANLQLEQAKPNLVKQLEDFKDRLYSYASGNEFDKGTRLHLPKLEKQIKEYSKTRGEDADVSKLYEEIKGIKFGDKRDQQGEQSKIFDASKQNTLNELEKIKRNLIDAIEDNPRGAKKLIMQFKKEAEKVAGGAHTQDPELKNLLASISNGGKAPEKSR